jgi:hypothetical protein
MAQELEPSEAVRHAKRWLASVFADERIKNLGLEEVRFQGGNWEITLGFDRFPQEDKEDPSTWAPLSKPRREYKVIVISGENNAVIEMRNREAMVE